MKITFFIGGLGKGGAERVVCNLSNYLVSCGHEIDIMTIGDDDNYGLDNRIKRYKLIQNHERKNVLIDCIRRLTRLLRYLKNKRDVFIVMLPFTTILLLKLRFLVKGKIIASERAFPSYYSKRQQSQLRKLSHRADAWIFQTKASRSWYGHSIGKAKSIIIANPINENFVKDYQVQIRRKIIVTAGRLTEVKNHALLIEAFSKIANEFIDYKLIIYGEGSLRHSLETEAHELGIGNRVSFPGFAEWGKESYDASLFVLSSNLEGMPNSLMEAMALGIPCISTDCEGGGAAFLIENEINGLLVPVNDVNALADAMRRMLNDHVFAEKCGKNAHDICYRLAPERIYGEWESFIKEVCYKKEMI